MDEYFIGAGAVLTAGKEASIRAASLHAQAGNGLAERVRAAVIDFEGTNAAEISRVILVAAGWSFGRFRTEVISRLLSRRDCSLADVMTILCRAIGTDELHLFAHWTPNPQDVADLQNAGLQLVQHPLEALGQAALVSGQRVRRWRPRRAA
ncbi:MAG: hypothetical protein JOY71_29100 [Acetobacteraceae bacterium]|nr:hypothetical protein [Acetobacteraceae bacterium]